jgi:uncharacterized protein (TIGR02453 family)
MPNHHTLQFLIKLEENNNREWFHANKADYEMVKAEFETFCQEVLAGLSQFQENLHQTKAKDCIFRINRDIRFSLDKSPYKKYLAAGFGPGGRNSGKVDFYLQIQAHETFLGGGMWSPTSSQLANFRQEIDYNPTKIKSIIEADEFKNYFSEIHGDKVKKTPKGYAIDHPDIELLKYKQLFFIHRYKNEEVFEKDFAQKIINGCRILKPYIDYVNQVYFEEKK